MTGLLDDRGTVAGKAALRVLVDYKLVKRGASMSWWTAEGRRLLESPPDL